ncbi:MAG: GNAT family N-acetyltransferase [Candidatus Eisenbacteria bacterium]|nr:GNAT family N-acetyltransferase [Candidatus Eisenbacteria bacterium]
MPPVEIRYRKCRKKDLLAATRLILSTANDLRVRTGKEVMLSRVTGPSPLIRHVFETDPDKMVCAWAGSRLVGFAGALQRGRQWYLAWLFVHPRYQDRGVGGRLLRKVWRDGPGMVHSLGTFTYNMQAVGLYSSFGMIPKELITLMEGRREKIRLPEPAGLERVLDLREEDFAWIHRLEKRIRGFARPEEWDFWRGEGGGRIVLFRRGGRRVAYGMLDERGFLAPVGAADPSDLIPAAAETARFALEEGRDGILVFCPNKNGEMYRFFLGAGFRNREMLLFQSDRSYADMSRYLPATLAFF